MSTESTATVNTESSPTTTAKVARRSQGKQNSHVTLKEVVADQTVIRTPSKAKWSNKLQYLIFTTLMAASALYMASLVAHNGLPK